MCSRLKIPITLLITLIVTNQGASQFIDHFDRTSPPAENGWAFATGDGLARIDLTQENGFATVHVDATHDRDNIWWALIKKQVPGLNIKQLMKPGFELRVEARIRVSHAPRRVNLHFNHQRTTDFHSHLMEYDIPDTVNWHVISMTTRDFEVQPGDLINAQMALMDWGGAKYRVDIDYFKVDVVDRSKAGVDKGNPLPYHPPVANPASYAHHVKAGHDATVDMFYREKNFDNWHAADDGATLLTVSGTQFVILRWDFSSLNGKKVTKSGLLELTTHTLQRSPDYKKDFGMVRVVEILGGNPAWDQKTVTYDLLCGNAPLEKVVNTQMIIDWEVTPGKGEKTHFTLSQPVLQRLIDGKTLGIAIRPLGAVNASFYSMENQNGELGAVIHLEVE